MDPSSINSLVFRKKLLHLKVNSTLASDMLTLQSTEFLLLALISVLIKFEGYEEIFMELKLNHKLLLTSRLQIFLMQ